MTEKAGGQKMTRHDLAALVSAFAPLVASCARRYEGRGAELDDLKQEGWLALVQIARTTNKRQFVQTVAHRLPGRVRDAAGRMRRMSGAVGLDEPASSDDAEDALTVGETVADPCAEAEIAALETWLSGLSGLAGLDKLTETERVTACAIAAGRTYDEIAAEANITKQAVAHRVRTMRRKLAPLRR